VIHDVLRQQRFRPREVWKLGKDRMAESPDAFLIVEESVQDKRYARFSALGRAQDRGNEHGVVRRIGVASFVQSAGKDEDFYPIDSRG
jgi:hypothetical protein